jgi:hypothetical protein
LCPSKYGKILLSVWSTRDKMFRNHNIDKIRNSVYRSDTNLSHIHHHCRCTHCNRSIAFYLFVLSSFRINRFFVSTRVTFVSKQTPRLRTVTCQLCFTPWTPVSFFKEERPNFQRIKCYSVKHTDLFSMAACSISSLTLAYNLSTSSPT